jgi:hypothetical protein
LDFLLTDPQRCQVIYLFIPMWQNFKLRTSNFFKERFNRYVISLFQWDSLLDDKVTVQTLQSGLPLSPNFRGFLRKSMCLLERKFGSPNPRNFPENHPATVSPLLTIPSKHYFTYHKFSSCSLIFVSYAALHKKQTDTI